MECDDLYGEKKSMCNFLIMYLRVFFSLARLSVSREDLYFAGTPINLLSVSLRLPVPDAYCTVDVDGLDSSHRAVCILVCRTVWGKCYKVGKSVLCSNWQFLGSI